MKKFSILFALRFALFGQEKNALIILYNDFIELVNQDNPPLSKDFNIGWNIIG